MKNTKNTSINIRINNELKDKIVEKASDSNITISKYVTKVIEDSFNNINCINNADLSILLNDLSNIISSGEILDKNINNNIYNKLIEIHKTIILEYKRR